MSVQIIGALSYLVALTQWKEGHKQLSGSENTSSTVTNHFKPLQKKKKRGTEERHCGPPLSEGRGLPGFKGPP